MKRIIEELLNQRPTSTATRSLQGGRHASEWVDDMGRNPKNAGTVDTSVD